MFKYISESSLFILHKDTMLRQFLLKLTTNSINRETKIKRKKPFFDKDIDSYGEEDIGEDGTETIMRQRTFKFDEFATSVKIKQTEADNSGKLQQRSMSLMSMSPASAC